MPVLGGLVSDGSRAAELVPPTKPPIRKPFPPRHFRVVGEFLSSRIRYRIIPEDRPPESIPLRIVGA